MNLWIFAYKAHLVMTHLITYPQVAPIPFTKRNVSTYTNINIYIYIVVYCGAGVTHRCPFLYLWYMCLFPRSYHVVFWRANFDESNGQDHMPHVWHIEKVSGDIWQMVVLMLARRGWIWLVWNDVGMTLLTIGVVHGSMVSNAWWFQYIIFLTRVNR